MVVLDLKFDFYFGNVHGWWVVNPFKGEFVKNCPKEGRKGGCVNLSVTDPENSECAPHSWADVCACLSSSGKDFVNFLRSVRVGATRKTWSQTLVTSRALLQILKNCFFTMKMAGLLSFVIILVTEFGCL